MNYIIQLHSNDDTIINKELFHIDNQAFIYIGRILTNSLFSIKIEIERKYLVTNGAEILTEIIYHLYEQNE